MDSRNKVTPHNWLQLVSFVITMDFSCTGRVSVDRRLGYLDIKVESGLLRPPKIKFLVSEVILIHRIKIHTVNTFCPYICHTAALNT